MEYLGTDHYILTYLCLFARWEHYAIDQGTPPFSVSGHLLHFSPGVSHLLCFFFGVSLPGVSWPTSSPLPWGVLCDGLMGDGFWWFPECMSYPPPFFFFISFSMGNCLVIFQSVVMGTFVCPLQV